MLLSARSKARFWWKLRDIWHMPNFWKQGCKYRGNTIRVVHLRWLGRSSIGFVFKTIIQDTYGYSRRFYWWLRWVQPLRCNGNAGGWRTRFCEYLEWGKARYWEDRNRVGLCGKQKKEKEDE